MAIKHSLPPSNRFFRSQQVLGAYKILLFLYTFTGFCASAALVLTLPVCFRPSLQKKTDLVQIALQTASGIFFFNTVERLPKGSAIIALIVFAVSYILWGLILALSFLYRCLTVRNKERLVFNRKGWLLIIISTFFITIFFVLLSWYYHPNEEMLDSIAERAYNVTGKDIYDLAVLGGEFFVSILQKGEKLCSEIRWLPWKRFLSLHFPHSIRLGLPRYNDMLHRLLLLLVCREQHRAVLRGHKTSPKTTVSFASSSGVVCFKWKNFSRAVQTFKFFKLISFKIFDNCI